MKDTITICIAVFQGTEFRNIIRTDFCKKLLENERVRLVLLTDTEIKKNYFESEFNHPRVAYEAVNHRPHRSTALFEFLKFNLVRTKTLDLKRRQWRDEKASHHIPYLFKHAFNRLFANRFFRSLARWLAGHIVQSELFAQGIERWQPDAVVLGHLFAPIETELLLEAKRRKIPTVGIIGSWDKLTARGMVLALPDTLVVHNPVMKQEAICYADMPEKQIRVVGVPQFDRYFPPRVYPREEFYRRTGLDPAKRFILFCPEGKTFIDSDIEVVRLLDECISTEKIPSDLEIVVRFPPNDAIEISGTFKDNVVIQHPGVNFSSSRSTNWDMTEEDFTLLQSTLFYSSLMIAYSSTMVIEAALFDKPIINMNIPFEGYPPTDWLYDDFEHYGPIRRTRGTRFVRSPGELAEAINQYLASPETDGPGREQIRKEQIYYFDGRASHRLAEVVRGHIRK